MSDSVLLTVQYRRWRYQALSNSIDAIYIQNNIIGAALPRALIGTVGQIRSVKEANSRIFFLFAVLRLLLEKKITASIVLAPSKGHERIDVLRQMILNSVVSWVVLGGNGNMRKTEGEEILFKKIIIVPSDPMPIPNNWKYFWSTLVFDRHYL